MRDIAFQCPHCSKNLAAGDRYVGVVFACPDCQVEISTPQPEFVFPCPACGCILFASKALRGEIYGCPDCEAPFEVPSLTTLRCAGCGVHLEVDDEWYADLAGSTVECPECGRRVDAPALPRPVFRPPAPSLPDTVVFRCRVCANDVRLQPQEAASRAGRLIRCPRCHGFILIPKEKGGMDERAVPRQTRAPRIMNEKPADFARTMRMDEILETIPQAHLLDAGTCLYCSRPLRQLDERTYVCKNCWRIVRKVRRR